MMKSNLKTVLVAFAGTCLISATLSACAQAGTERAPGPNAGQQLQNMQTQGINRNNLVNTTTELRQGNMTDTNPGNNQGMNLRNNQGMNLGNNQANQQQTAPNRQKADNIKRQLMNMNGVADANVIVMGNTALVGFKPSGNRGDVNAVRSNIMNKVKEIDSTITNVTVSESADIMDRMNRLGTDITNNRPVNTITDEFNKMIDGLNPATQ